MYLVGQLIKKLLYRHFRFIRVVEKLPKIKWDPIVDDKPNTTSPRIKFSQEFTKENQRKSNGNVLDLGCGTGSFTYIVDREGCVGIDLHINALKIAKKYCKCSEFIVSSAFNLPFRDETFDIVFMWEVLEYLKPGSETKLIQEVHNVSTPRAAAIFVRSKLSSPPQYF